MSQSESARQLAAVLDRGGAAAEKIRATWHRTMLWNWKTGRRKPSVDHAAQLQEIHRGIRADGWSDETPARAAS